MNRKDRQTVTAGRAGGRRQEYAEVTRQAIVSAARRLFAERGYFATRVEDIAAEARVAPATVYAVWGGKYGLLKKLVDIWQSSPAIAGTLEELLRLDDPVMVIRVLSARTRQIREEYNDIIKTVLATAPNDQDVSATLDKVISYYRGSINIVSQHLAGLNALRPGADVPFATDVLWFYFGFPGLSAMHDDNGWSYDNAEKWLADEAIRALLAHAE
ncbi:MAG TPA: helix-turn-helix domain-containing protein [Trebonia sp.]|nr:helix-turn-helix domain-containing protein [Trebonia sp.]